MISISAFLISILAICILVYFSYVGQSSLASRMGSNTQKIVSRLMAFLVFCVGLQIAADGISGLIKSM
jgi:multiple antibiotic resistance protein